VYNVSVRVVASPTTGRLTGVDILGPTVIGNFNHTYFGVSTDAKQVIVSCPSCNGQLGMIRVFQRNESAPINPS